MPSVKVDQQQVAFENLQCEDTDGTSVDTLCFVIPVIVPIDQFPAWDSAYDSTNQYSPSATDSRIIARAVLDALKKAAEEP
jgi:hypothetical protein